MIKAKSKCGLEFFNDNSQGLAKTYSLIVRSLIVRHSKRLTMKSPVVINSTLVSRVFKISLNTRPISFLDTFDTAQISAAEKHSTLH